MTKEAFLAHIRAVYRAANMADSDNPERPVWMHADMAGTVCCQHLDGIMRSMLEIGTLSGEEYHAFYDTL